MSHITISYRSPVGIIEIGANSDKITSVSFADTINDTAGKPSPVLKEVIKQFDEYFAGERKAFSLGIELNGTDFQTYVWQELMNIPYGTVISYSQLAHNIGKPDAIRAVAAAVGANKLAILIPCHRVIGKDGSLTGYRWGIERKKRLLELESGFRIFL